MAVGFAARREKRERKKDERYRADDRSVSEAGLFRRGVGTVGTVERRRESNALFRRYRKKCIGSGVGRRVLVLVFLCVLVGDGGSQKRAREFFGLRRVQEHERRRDRHAELELESRGDTYSGERIHRRSGIHEKPLRREKASQTRLHVSRRETRASFFRQAPQKRLRAKLRRRLFSRSLLAESRVIEKKHGPEPVFLRKEVVVLSEERRGETFNRDAFLKKIPVEK